MSTLSLLAADTQGPTTELWGTGIPAAYLVLLLAITVPHALISARTDGVTPR